jgi:hypothetical protein
VLVLTQLPPLMLEELLLEALPLLLEELLELEELLPLLLEELLLLEQSLPVDEQAVGTTLTLLAHADSVRITSAPAVA